MFEKGPKNSYTDSEGSVIQTKTLADSEIAAVEAGTAWPTLEGLQSEDIQMAFKTYLRELSDNPEKSKKFADELAGAVAWAKQYKGEKMNLREQIAFKLNSLSGITVGITGGIVCGVVAILLSRSLGYDHSEMGLAAGTAAVSGALLFLNKENARLDSVKENFYENNPEVKRIEDSIQELYKMAQENNAV